MPAYKPETFPISIRRLVEDALKGEIDIPEFQREFIWTKDQVKDLLDSLIKGYPIGSLLIWDLNDYTTGKHVFEQKKKEWIVDGQQRIVSLCLLTSRKPYWMEITEWNELINKYKIKVNILTLDVALEYSAIKKDPVWVYPREIFNVEKEEELEKIASELSNKIDAKLFTKIYNNIKRIWDLQDITIPVIKVNTSLENIATIFERINSAGTRIKQADVTLSYIAAYNEGWIRENFMKYLDALEDKGFYFDPTLIIRAITTVGENKAIIRDVSDNFLKNKDGILNKAFSDFKRSLERLILDLTNFGVLNSDLIYAKNTIIPLIYLYHKFQNQFDFNKAFHFFLVALAQGRYSGSAESTLQEDINKIQNASNFDEAITKLHGETNTILITKDSVKNAVHYQGEGRFLKLVLYLVVYRNQATDWFTKVRLGYFKSNEINRDFTIEEHHFFPRSLLRNVGIEKDKREALANIVFINPGTNKRLREQPYTYIKKYNIDNGELLKQLIPLDEQLWKLENYDAFLEKRSEIIAAELKKFMASLYPSLYAHAK
ncbi:MAG: GmrSD restriction endonuclease domain-containing protein [Thermoproteota archaeon]